MKTALGLYRDEQGKGAAAPLPRTLSPPLPSERRAPGAPIAPEKKGGSFLTDADQSW
jgi:hypothetical protein